MNLSALPYVLLLSLLWGTNAVASRYGIGEFNPFFFILLRVSIASLFFIPSLLFAQGKLPTDKTLWKKAALSGILGVAIPFPTFVLSLQYQSTGVATLYVTTFPVMVVIAAHFFLPDERMTRNKAIGVALAMSGALFLALRGESGLANVGRANPLGAIFVIGGLFFEVANTMFVRRQMKQYDPLQVTMIRLLVAAVVLLGVTAVLGNFSLAQVSRAGNLWPFIFNDALGQPPFPKPRFLCRLWPPFLALSCLMKLSHQRCWLGLC
jgi:drug/metabolite transporter (DMT)-like permease